jgi:hypothetical protein
LSCLVFSCFLLSCLLLSSLALSCVVLSCVVSSEVRGKLLIRPRPRQDTLPATLSLTLTPFVDARPCFDQPASSSTAILSMLYHELHRPASEFTNRAAYLEHELQIMSPRRYALNLPGRDFRFEVRQDKTRQNKTRQDKTRQDKTKQDKRRKEKTRGKMVT